MGKGDVTCRGQIISNNLFVQKQNSIINGGNKKNTEESLDLDDIDKICREIEIDEEEKRKKRKRGYPQNENNSVPVSISSGFSNYSDFDTVR